MTRRRNQSIVTILHIGLKLFALFAQFAQSANAQTSVPQRLHVMIDPGHGGTDTGASRGSIKESEVALKVALRLGEEIKSDSRFKVSLTRTTDRKLSLPARTRMAEDSKADVFLSVHLNSSTDSRARGVEVYFQNQLPADEEAMFLVGREHEQETGAQSFEIPERAESISAQTDLKRILEDLHRNQRIINASELAKRLIEAVSHGQGNGRHQIRQAPFQVVQNITIPSVLVELGFISHPQEALRLLEDDYQKQMVTNLFQGLVKYKETIDKDATEKLKSKTSLQQD
jgi:N-acetylmuramoyl-L-alanine amidase